MQNSEPMSILVNFGPLDPNSVNERIANSSWTRNSISYSLPCSQIGGAFSQCGSRTTNAAL